jgi:hypothetical protein
LLCLYNICANCQAGDVHSRTKAELISKLILGELVRRQNDRLVEQVGKLIQVADAQKHLAEDAGKQAQNLLNQTDKLVRLTWGLVAVSVALLVFAIVQTTAMFKQDAGSYAQQIQAGQHQKGATP